jgi:glutathione S-transferase
MNLYYSKGACSLSPHIVAMEAGIPVTLVAADMKTKKTADGLDYFTVNAKGAVPALQLDDGRVLTEGPAIVQYLADLKPDTKLAPKAGTFERYQLMELLNYITSELHKGFSPLFNPAVTPETREATIATLSKKFDWVAKYLGNKTYLMGDTFTVADAYLFTILNWSNFVKVDMSKWPTLTAFSARVAARPKVQEALKAEGLLR